MRKTITLTLITVLLLTSVLQISATEAPRWIYDREPTTIKLYYDRPVDGAEVAQSNGNEPVSMKWTEETGVSIDFSYAVDDSHTKLNMLIASGDYPDILVCQSSYDMLNELAKANVILALNKEGEQYSPGFVERNMSANTILSVRQAFQTQDIFALPTYSFKVEEMQRNDISRTRTGHMVLKSVYEAIGSPDMTTVEGFLNALRKVKEMYPDMIPIQASRNSSKDSDGNPRCIGRVLSFFNLNGRYYLDEESETYKKYWNSPNFYELLRFVNTLYNEGLMDPTELTDSGEQLQAKLFTGKVFCNMNNDADNIDWFNGELTAAGLEDEWIFVDQMSINTEEGYTYDGINGGVGDHCIVIFNTPNAEKAVQWVDFIMQDETQREIVLGVKGLTWDYNQNNIPELFPEIKAITSNERKTIHGVSLWYFLRQNITSNIVDKYTGSAEQASAIDFMNKYYKDYSFFGSSRPESYDSNSQEMRIFTNIKEYYEVEILQLIMCKPEELQAKFNAMINKMNELGQQQLDAYIDNYFKNRKASILEYGSDLDLSFMGLE